MKSTYLAQLFTDTSLTVVGLVIFFTFFLLVCAWVFARKDALEHYNQMAQFPMNGDGDQHERR